MNMRNMTVVVIMAFAILSLGGWICLAVGAAMVIGFLFLMRMRGKKLDAKAE